MELERGENFFHYTTKAAAFEHILPTGKLRFSRYLDMRDPLENKLWRFIGGGWGEKTDEERDQQQAAHFEFSHQTNQIRERSFLLSMTVDASSEDSGEEEPFCRGWARARMWEQYAENHAGVCLVFDRALLTDSVVASLQDQGFAAPYHREVVYDGAGMRKPALDWNALAGNVTPQGAREYVEANHDVLFFHKALDWATEREYRFSTTSSDIQHLFVDFGQAFTAIVVGESFPVWQRASAIEACEGANVWPGRLDWTNGWPALRRLQPIRTRRDEIRETLSNLRGAGPPAADPPQG